METQRSIDSILVDVLNSVGRDRIMIALIEDESFNYHYTEVLIHDEDDETKLKVEPLTLARRQGDENKYKMLFDVERNNATQAMCEDQVDVYGALCTYADKYTMNLVQWHDETEAANELLDMGIIRSFISFKKFSCANDMIKWLVEIEDKHGKLEPTEIQAYWKNMNDNELGFDSVFGFYNM